MTSSKYFLSFFPAILAGFALAANPIPNSSFELGVSGIGTCNYHKGTPREQWKPISAEIDSSTAAHGKNSLKLTMPEKAECEFSFPGVALSGQGIYTISLYAKADRAGKIRVQLFSSHPFLKGKPETWEVKLQYLNITTEWKRYEIQVKCTGLASHAMIQLILDDNPMTLWVDGFQLEKANQASAYSPAAPVEAGLDMPQPGYRFVGKHDLSLFLANNEKNAKKVDVELTESDPKSGYRKVFHKKSYDLEPESTKTVTISHDFQHRGMLTYGGTITGGKVNPFYLAVLSELPKKAFNPEIEFGAGVNDPPSIRRHRKAKEAVITWFQTDTEMEYVRLRASGVRWLRYWLRWLYLEPVEGEFHWEIYDANIDLMRKNGIEPLILLGDRAITTKKGGENANWFIVKRSRQGKRTQFSSGSVRNFPAMDDWKRHIRDVVTHFKGRVRYYEIMNEPNLIFDPEEYVPYLKAAYETAKAVDPNCKIVGICATGDYSGRLGEFIDSCGKLGAFQYCDIVSFHPYSAQLDSDAIPAEIQLAQVHGIVNHYRKETPIWNSELYYIHSLRENSKMATSPTASPRTQAMLKPEHLLRRMLIDFSNGIAQSQAPQSNQLSINPYAEKIEVMDIWKNFRPVPTPPAVALNAFSLFAEGAKNMKRIQPRLGVNGSSFTHRDGREVAVIWAVDEEDRFHLSVKPGIQVFDLFGNPIAANGKILIDGRPVWMIGKSVKGGYQLEPVCPYIVRGARAFDGQKKFVAVELFNATPSSIKLTVRLKGVKGNRVVELPAQSAKSIFFPVLKFQSDSTVIISDGKNITSFPVKVIPPRKAVKSGTKAGMPYGSFTATQEKAGLRFAIRVKDDARGDRTEKKPWDGDCIELFLDLAPELELNRNGLYHDRVFRLFAVPASRNGLPKALTASGNVKTNLLKWNLKETGADYQLDLFIPWTALNVESAPELLAFDVTVNNSDGEKRNRTTPWAGGKENYGNRFLFGTLSK